MKMYRYIILAILLTVLSGSLMAQEEQERTRSRERTDENKGTELTVRAQAMNEQLTPKVNHAPWQRTVYRFVDLKEEKNLPLYYPPQPVGNDMNLFTTIFRLMAEGKISVYDYSAEYEDFSENNVSNLKDILDKNYILYKEEAVPGNSKAVAIEIDNSDIPSEEALGFYMKEMWYFDQQTSTYNSEIISLCPILFRSGEFGDDVARFPMFWVTYESIRPYISKTPVVTSDLNNARTLTLDDYFRKRMYNGEIYKVANMMNRSLDRSNPDSLKAEQDRIEKQLETFSKAIWTGRVEEESDSTDVDANIDKRSSKGRSSSTAAGRTSSSAKSSSSSKATKSSSAKAPKAARPASAAPVNSVRKTR